MNTKNPDTYCALSHVSLAVQNEGDVCVCNKSLQSLQDGKLNNLYLHDAGLEKIWKSPIRKLVYTALDYGKKISSCDACWKDEEAGIVSSRIQFNQELAGIDVSKDQPRILILKPTNTCNMGCRMCQPSTSTSLYSDFYKLETQMNGFSGSFGEYTQQFETIRSGLGKQNTQIWDTFEKWLPGLIFLDIYGGEPMLAPAMWDRIMSAANQDKLSNTKVQFHTNGTIWNQKYIDTLHKFKSVKIGISIDSHNHTQLGYIRHGVDVEKLFENLNRYQLLTQQHKHISLYICCTVSIYNIWYLDEIATELKKFGLQVGLNFVYGPEQYDVRHLPQKIKNQLIVRFSSDSYLSKAVSLLKHTIPGCDIYWPKFCKEVEILDQIRNQHFKDAMPEYHAALEPFWQSD
jgi:MoaA/NifB/PqqE/SkfB family radical SAM enzyme